MTHQYKKLPVTMKMLMQFNVMPRTDVEMNSSELHECVSKKSARKNGVDKIQRGW